MGCIVRTAGLERTKTEIKRDFDYLTRLWDEIRDNTLRSSAPALIHEDSDLIKRAIRDIYSREIDDVLVEGDEGYRAAKAFMKQRIFDKVGMSHSISRFSELRQQPNIAYSHARRDGNVKVIEQFRSEEHTSELQSLMRTSYAV